MFPERQLGPHKEWKAEVEYLDAIFPGGAAYTIGKVNGDHWLLYMTEPGATESAVPRTVEILQSEGASQSGPSRGTDYTIEIMMTHLSPVASEPFFSPEFGEENTPSAHARALSLQTGISELFPSHLTVLDAYSFTPCGYSSNALLKWSKSPVAYQDAPSVGEGYYSIHVTPESGWSYASFECNVPLPALPAHEASSIPDLQTLVRRIVKIFQPAKLTLTLFISSAGNNSTEEEEGISAVEAAQRAFKLALTSPSNANGGERNHLVYKRTDKINYEFASYDLAFASFELHS